MNTTPEALALHILQKGQFDTLPIKISHLAKINHAEYLNDFSHEKFQNCTQICQFLLENQNLPADSAHAKQLATLVMAPKCVLRHCKLNNADELHVLTALPLSKAQTVFQSLHETPASPNLQSLETAVTAQFEPFISNRLNQKPQFHKP